MVQKFRLFVQRHDNGTYTVTVPGIDNVWPADGWDDDLPETPRLAAHALALEEAKEDVRAALEKWLATADPASLANYGNYHPEQCLEKVDVELRPSDRRGRKRHDKVRMRFSLLVTPADGQFLVRVPKLLDPPLAFYCYSLEELPEAAGRELAAYFSDISLEDLLPFQYQRQEVLDEVQVSFTPLKPQKERKRSHLEADTEHWALKASGVNLSARVGEGSVRRAFRRDREVAEILGILAGERANSVLLVGPSGAGKTAILHEVVRRLRDESCPAALRDRQVWYTTANQLMAGCAYMGEWQGKLQDIVDEVKRARHLLYVDDVTGLMEAGRWSKGDENMAQFLKPFLADGTLVLLGESTPERHQAGEVKDPAFLGLFRTLRVEETNEETTLSILGAVAAGLEREFGVRIEPGAGEAVVELTRRFEPYRAFPGKAIAVLERIAADAGRAGAGGRSVISRQVTVSRYAGHTGLPEFLLSDQRMLDPAAVERHFGERLIGQPDAVSAMTDLVTVIKAGLNDPQKPLGCFFFVGPTGVGKTEMVKVLAEYLFGSRDRIIRFDMSEYAEPMNVAKLIGSALGDEEGELTKRIRQQPFSVVLLDEFEKAHSSIFDVMLQVLGEGRLPDAAGRTADFRSAIIIMTSNLGASPREQRRTGLRVEGTHLAAEAHFLTQVEGFFRPEFVNRIDRIVVFRALDREAMQRIAAREMNHLLAREGITRRNLLVEMDGAVIDLLLETGFSPVYGARPLKREIERRVIVPLARYLVAHQIAGAHLVRIGREGGEVRLQATALTEAKQTVRRAAAPLAGAESAERMDPGAMVEGLADLRRRLHAWAQNPIVDALRQEWQDLLARTRERDFTAHGQDAHKTWSRIYHLERLTKRLEQLTGRAEYLEEFAVLARRDRSHAYQADLARNYADLRRDVDFLEVELLCAHLEESAHALVSIRSLGRGRQDAGAWPLQLARMYLLWAQRKGYGTAAFVPAETYRRWLEECGLDVAASIPGFSAGPPVRPAWAEVKAGDAAGILRRLEEMAPTEVAVSVQGTNVFGFLKGEAGAHKWLTRGGDDAAAPFHTTVVGVEAVCEGLSVLDVLNAPAEEEEDLPAGKKAKKDEDAPEIVRIYQPEGDRYVRDLRTEVRTTLVRDVLDGELDEFLLACLRGAGESG